MSEIDRYQIIIKHKNRMYYSQFVLTFSAKAYRQRYICDMWLQTDVIYCHLIIHVLRYLDSTTQMGEYQQNKHSAVSFPGHTPLCKQIHGAGMPPVGHRAPPKKQRKLWWAIVTFSCSFIEMLSQSPCADPTISLSLKDLQQGAVAGL